MWNFNCYINMNSVLMVGVSQDALASLTAAVLRGHILHRTQQEPSTPPLASVSPTQRPFLTKLCH